MVSVRILGAFVMGLAFATNGLASSQTFNLDHEHVPGELIVTFHDSVQKSAKMGIFNKLNAYEAHIFRSSPSSHIKFFEKGDQTWLFEQAKYLASLPEVKSVEANTILRALDGVVPNDPMFERLYGLHNTGSTGGTAGADISAPSAWSISTGSKDVLIGVIDTGIDYNHPDIAPNYWTNPGESGADEAGNDKRTNGIDDDENGYVDDWRGWNFVHNNNDPMDDNRHGTHCAGTIGAHGNDEVGVVGVAWEVSMVGIKFLSASGSGSLVDAVKAIEYGTTIGADLTSNSWGGGGYSETMHAAILEANEKGILFVAAAGNSSSNNDTRPSYPATYEADNIISVAATDHNDQMASFSSYGPTTVHVAAPGVNTWSAVPNNQYQSLSGTSMATPHVAGVVALVKAAYPEVSSAQVKERILNGVDVLPHLADKVSTSGRLNAFNALENDDTSPGVVRNIEVLSSGMTTLQLGWDVTGDDGYEGYASRYLVRYAAEPILDEGDWEAASLAVTTVMSDLQQPTIMSEISELSFNARGYLVVRAVDNVGNMSELSENVPFSVRAMVRVAGHVGDTMDEVTADQPWGIEHTDHGPAFSDSPNGQYGNSVNASLVLPAVATANEMLLTFQTQYEFENNFDFGHIEVSTDNGNTYERVARLTGTSGWTSVSHNLTPHIRGSESFLLRFRVTSDYSVTKNGWLINQIDIFAPAAE